MPRSRAALFFLATGCEHLTCRQRSASVGIMPCSQSWKELHCAQPSHRQLVFNASRNATTSGDNPSSGSGWTLQKAQTPCSRAARFLFATGCEHLTKLHCRASSGATRESQVSNEPQPSQPLHRQLVFNDSMKFARSPARMAGSAPRHRLQIFFAGET